MFQIVCSYCKKGEKLKKCSRCKSSYYCSNECQLKDWGNHKKYCGNFEYNKENIKMCKNIWKFIFNYGVMDMCQYLTIRTYLENSSLDLIVEKDWKIDKKLPNYKIMENLVDMIKYDNADEIYGFRIKNQSNVIHCYMDNMEYFNKNDWYKDYRKMDQCFHNHIFKVRNEPSFTKEFYDKCGDTNDKKYWFKPIIFRMSKNKIYNQIPNNIDKYKLMCKEICDKIGEKLIYNEKGIYNGKNIYIDINNNYEEFLIYH
jgi:hypothetical protein